MKETLSKEAMQLLDEVVARGRIRWNVARICSIRELFDAHLIEQIHGIDLRPPVLDTNMYLIPARPKHDGRLDNNGKYIVIWKEDGYRPTVDIHYPDRCGCGIDYLEFTPQQALSLLDWLKQRESELRGMAGVVVENSTRHNFYSPEQALARLAQEGRNQFAATGEGSNT